MTDRFLSIKSKRREDGQKQNPPLDERRPIQVWTLVNERTVWSLLRDLDPRTPLYAGGPIPPLHRAPYAEIRHSRCEGPGARPKYPEARGRVACARLVSGVAAAVQRLSTAAVAGVP